MKTVELRCQNSQCKRHGTIVTKEQCDDDVVFIDGTCPHCKGSMLHSISEPKRKKKKRSVFNVWDDTIGMVGKKEARQ